MPDTSTDAESPTLRFCAGISPSAIGAWFPLATKAANTCVADSPPGSVAVSDTKDVPTSIPTSVSIVPSSEAVATVVSSLSTVRVRVSPSGSVKVPETSRVTVPPTARSWCGIVSVSTGPRLTVVTVKLAVCVADSPSGSVAVSVIVVSPAPTATTVMMLPDIEAVTTIVSPETAA